MRCVIFCFFFGAVLSCLSVNTCSASDECDFLIRADVMFVWYPPVPPEPPDELAYDDGTAYWLTWAGLYRGTYFIPEEFYLSIQDCMVEGAEFWFYHHTSYPWDTS
ncbi:MAG: hypothetical protein K8S62_00230 [Candidatus Sabulitectum sp.]|nr:hypothetical protein [Candidatus Sabulitectum sp.]